jgi:hypothetical protein
VKCQIQCVAEQSLPHINHKMGGEARVVTTINTTNPTTSKQATYQQNEHRHRKHTQHSQSLARPKRVARSARIAHAHTLPSEFGPVCAATGVGHARVTLQPTHVLLLFAVCRCSAFERASLGCGLALVLSAAGSRGRGGGGRGRGRGHAVFAVQRLQRLIQLIQVEIHIAVGAAGSACA